MGVRFEILFACTYLESDTTNSNAKPCYIAVQDVNGARNGDIVAVELHNRTDGKSSGKFSYENC